MDGEKSGLGLKKQSPQILSMIYEDLAQPSVRKVGQALDIVFEFGASLLLPLKLRNEKCKINFQRNLDNYKRKLEGVPNENIIEVNPQIGIPIIEKLAYTTNEELADLFTTLLSKASSKDTINQAHPSFVQFIERLSVDEARLIKFLRGKSFIPSVSFRGMMLEGDGFIELEQLVTLLPYEVEFLFSENILTYIGNLESMGILDTKHGNYKTDEAYYKPILEKYGYDYKRNVAVEQKKYKDIEYDKGYLQITELGKSFIIACTQK